MRYGLLLTLFTILHCSLTAASPIPDRTTLDLLTPSLSHRTTKKIRLENGLEAYLISDPNAETSGAVLTVQAGSWQDPTESPGMAHFLEHLLFLGTKKYPIESDYDRFITEHGGLSNAFTGNDLTAYIFDVNNSAFPEALDRFSSFFKEPLFNPSGVAREMQAIDQEYAKNRENDMIRELYVHKELTSPEHPYHAFNMGNSKTLSSVKQEALKKWYRNHYSANLMRVVLYSSLPISEMEQLATESLADIPNYNHSPLALEKAPLMPSGKQRYIFIDPIKDIRKVTLVWTLPEEFASMKETQPETLVCYVLGHEGKESLLAQLKREKLAETLSCGGYRAGPSMMQFYLEIGLTKEGLTHLNQVVHRTFQALALLKEKGIPQAIYDDVKKIHTARYQYQPRRRAFFELMDHAKNLSYEPMETYPEMGKVIQKFDPVATKKLINSLSVDTVQIDIQASKAETGVTPEKKEQWIGVPYTIRGIPSDIISKWKSATPHPQITLPPSNPYLPENLQPLSAPISKEFPLPQIIQESPKGVFYFAKDTLYQVPKLFLSFQIRTPAINAGDARKTALTDLYIKCVKDALDPYTYPAQIADLDFSIEQKTNGIEITVDGYSEKAPLLLKEILSRLKKVSLTNKKFQILKESLLRKYQNRTKEMPLKQAAKVLVDTLYEYQSTPKEKALALKKITKEDFAHFAPSLFEKTYLEGMLYGNLSELEAKQFAKQIQDTFRSMPYPKEDQLNQEVATLPQEKGPLYIEKNTHAEGNSIILAIQNTPFSFSAYAMQQVLMQGIHDKFYATLRTKQQTGYIVHSVGEEMYQKLFALFAVQSNTHGNSELLSRFELFIEMFMQELTTKSLPKKRFEKIKQTLIEQLRHPPKNLTSMGTMLADLAFEYDAQFDWREKRIQALEELEYESFVQDAKAFLGRGNSRRLAIFVKGVLPKENQFRYKKVVSLNKLRHLLHY